MIEITVKSKCSCIGCNSEVTETINFSYVGIGMPFFPPIPTDWHRLDGDIICNKHIIGVMNQVEVPK